ncbi:MAG TPA: CvpA family protein [Verrucomicrobiae bacterium]|nr:CvpA family protein [Verrucomicrobiae bacterium]
MNATLPINWFDVLTVMVLLFGVRQGRKHGLSEELMSMLKWLAIALGCAFLYHQVGSALADHSVFSLLSSYLMAYVALGLVFFIGFSYLKKAAGGKLIGSDAFGSSEFYLGMVAGVVRLGCVLIASLALLNARAYSTAEIQAAERYQNEVYGSDFFPSLYEVQSQVFQHSLTGSFIRGQLGFLLIKPTVPESKEFQQREFATP